MSSEALQEDMIIYTPLPCLISARHHLPSLKSLRKESANLASEVFIGTLTYSLRNSSLGTSLAFHMWKDATAVYQVPGTALYYKLQQRTGQMLRLPLGSSS